MHWYCLINLFQKLTKKYVLLKIKIKRGTRGISSSFLICMQATFNDKLVFMLCVCCKRNQKIDLKKWLKLKTFICIFKVNIF